MRWYIETTTLLVRYTSSDGVLSLVRGISCADIIRFASSKELY
jgi:hypothetical protein